MTFRSALRGVALGLTALLLQPLRGSTAPTRRKEAMLPAIVPMKCEVRSPNERRRYPSPDGRYVARLQHGEGDTWELTILGRASGRRLLAADDVMGIVWIPGHSHWLVVATCGVYGVADLGLWQGGQRWRGLY